MKERKVQSKSRYLFAFIIGTLIFIAGFVITYSISYASLGRINNIQQDTAYEIFSDKLEHSLFGKDLCLTSTYNEISEDLGFQGRIIDDLERKFGKNNKDVLFRKEFYTLIELEHFEYVRERNEICGEFVNTILFFYSNELGDIEESEALGRMLGTVHLRNEDLVIYSFDVNLDSPLVDELKEKYDIRDPATLIINEVSRVSEISFAEEIEEHFL